MVSCFGSVIQYGVGFEFVLDLALVVLELFMDLIWLDLELILGVVWFAFGSWLTLASASVLMLLDWLGIGFDITLFLQTHNL